MARTEVSHITLTVSTVEVFVEMMRFISERDLWEDAQSYLESNGKTEMFVDYEVLDMFRDMLKQHRRFEPEHPAVIRLLKHLPG